MDFVYFSKVLPPLLFPFNIALLCFLLAFFLRKRGFKQTFLGLGLIILFVASNPIIAVKMLKNLERQYLPYSDIQTIPKTQAIVILGGTLSPPFKPRNTPNFNDSVDRFIYGAYLYNAKRAPKIIISGGNVFQQQEGINAEAYYIKETLTKLGVKESDIFIEGKSRNTYENAQYTKQLMAQLNISKITLITSAFHMPRSYKVFKSARIDVIPAPTDFIVVDSENKPHLLSFIPSLGALNISTQVLREYMGLFVYRLKGFIDSKDNS